MIVALCALCLLCAVAPAVLFCVNLGEYVEPPVVSEMLTAVSILIPARNEAAAIGAAVAGALSTRDVDFEIVVMDDGSTDGTDAIVLAIAANDSRLRLERAPALPAGWNGKQHACWSLAQAAKNPVLCFVDADVSLGPDCVARMAQFMQSSGSALVSGFPRQVTVSFLEWMLLPLIHFVLLGFLPIGRMRRGTDPAFAAGCGQFMMCRREQYFACGGHSEIKLTMHDGLLLPRLFRAAGFRTDLADITSLASCRMYISAAQVWNGLAKNATEGIAAPTRIVPVSLVLLMGQVLPFAYFLFLLYFFLGSIFTFVSTFTHHTYIFGITNLGALILGLMAVSVLFAWFARVMSAIRFKQDRRSALLHPFGILLLLAVQWYALLRKLRGGRVSWRGRAYAGDQQTK